MTKRLKYLDYAKGIGIIALLFAHTMNTEENYIGIWITSWFMPIFFIVSGIILQKKFRGGTTTSDILTLVKKRIFQLVIPFVIFCTLLALFYSGLSVVSGEKPDIVSYIFRIVKFEGIDSLWFIPCYFLTELLMCILLLVKGVIGKIIRIGFLLFGICSIIFTLRFPRVLVFDCYVFTYIGFLFGRFDLIGRINIFFACILFAAGVPLAIYNGGVGMAALLFNKGYLYIINAIITSTAIISICRFIEQKEWKLSFLDYFGKNSIVVLCTNNLLIETIRLLDGKLTGNFLLSTGIWGSILFTLILIGLEFLIIKISEGPLGVIFGKKRKN